MAGEAGQGFFRRQAEQGAGHVHHQERRQGGRGAGVVVGGQGDGHARGAQRGHRRQVGVAQEVVGPRQQHGHRAGRGQGLHAGVVQVLQMVAAQALVAAGQGGAAAVAQLLGMQLDRQAQGAGAAEQAVDLRGAEGDVLAEAVHRVHQALGLPAGQPVAQGLDVVVGPTGELRRQGVGTQGGGAHRHRQPLAHGPRHPQAAGLVGLAQAVAGLDLHRGHAFAQQHPGTAQRGVQQGRIAGVAGGLHGRADAAAGAGNLLVAGTLQAQLEFACPVAAIDQVGVAVDQAGGDDAAAPVVLGVHRQAGRQRGGRAHPGDALAFGDDGAVGDPAPGAVGAQGGQVGAAPEGAVGAAHRGGVHGMSSRVSHQARAGGSICQAPGVSSLQARVCGGRARAWAPVCSVVASAV